MREIDKIAERITRNYKKVAVDKVTPNLKDDILKKLNDVLMSGTSKRILNNEGIILMKKANVIRAKQGRTLFTEEEAIKQLQPKFLKDFTKVINKKNKLRPIFGTVDEYAKDPKTGS